MLGGRFVFPSRAAGQEDALEPVTIAARSGAGQDVEAFRNARPQALFVSLRLECKTDGPPRAISQAELISILRSCEDVILEAPPGAGKSTILLQLADGILAETIDRVPVVMPLPELAVGQRTLLDEVALRAGFRPLGIERLRRLAVAGRLVLLMDGWNELAPEQRSFVRHEIEKFRRDYPENPILLATRPQALALPVGAGLEHHPHRMFLSPLSEAQQRALLTAELRSDGAELHYRASRVPGLRDILEIPLYTRAIASIGAGGALPTSKEELVRRFVETHERDAARRDELDRTLWGLHTYFLRRVGAHMTRCETTALRDADLRREIAFAASELVSAGQITARPEPRRVIDVLVAHHILVERIETGSERLFGFQHQQFQEWFASFDVEERMVSAAVPEPIAQASARLDEILDQPSWEESLLFAVERLSRRGEAGRSAVARTILRALGIDPMLAAEMIHRSAAEVWTLIAEPMLRFANSWSDSSQADRALAFMLASGRPEFADRVWRLFDDEALYLDAVHLRGRGCLIPSVLGVDARARITRLKTERRGTLLRDLIASGEQAGTELAVEIAKNESDAAVLVSLLVALEFEGADRYLAEILVRAPDEVWRLLARRHALANLPESLAERLFAEKTILANSLPPSAERLRLRLDIDNAADNLVDPNDLVADALDISLGEHPVAYRDRVFSRLVERHPETLSRAIIARTIDGRAVPFEALKHVRVAEAQHQLMLSGIAADPSSDGRVREVAARALDISSVSALIYDYFALDEIRGRVRYRGQSESSVVAERLYAAHYCVMADAFHRVPLEVLVGAVSDIQVDEPRPIASLAELLSQWRDDDHERVKLPVPTHLEGRLCDRVKAWVARSIDHPDVRRHELCAVAVCIRRIGQPALLPEIKRLLDRDLVLWREQRAMRDDAWRRGRHDLARDSDATMSYVEMYRHAFEAFDAELVRDMLLGYLNEADFAVQAAFALCRSGGRGGSDKRADPFRKEWELVAVRRREHTNTAVLAHGRPAHPVAAAVLDRVDALLATGGQPAIAQAVALATAAAQMEFGDRWSTLEAAVKAPGPTSVPYHLLHRLLLAGESLRPEWVIAGLDNALERITGNIWQENQEWWQVERWLELAAFTLASPSIIGLIRRLPSSLKQPYRLRSLVGALAFSDAMDAVATLEAIADEIPTMVCEYEWCKSLERLGSEEAARLFVRMAFDDNWSSALLRGIGLENSLANLVRPYPAVRNELLKRLSHSPSEASRAIVARLVPALHDQEIIVGLLDIVRPDGRDPLRAALVRAVEELAVFKRPVAGASGLYEQEPAELTWLRKRLFEVVRAGGPALGVALGLIVTLDRSRDRYGKPSTERRHPDLASNTPWPLEARVAWDAAERRR